MDLMRMVSVRSIVLSSVNLKLRARTALVQANVKQDEKGCRHDRAPQAPDPTLGGTNISEKGSQKHDEDGIPGPLKYEGKWGLFCHYLMRFWGPGKDNTITYNMKASKITNIYMIL